MIPNTLNSPSSKHGMKNAARVTIRIVMTGMAYLVVAAPMISAFAPKFPSHQHNMRHSITELHELIPGTQAEDPVFDEGKGGVRLAQESAIKVAGYVDHKPGKAESRPMELLRYNSLSVVEQGKVKEILKKAGSMVLCLGQGVELYKDPKETTEVIVKYGPSEAVKDALTNAASAMESDNLVFNFLGGDDLMMGEVLEAASDLVLMLDVPTKAKIAFNSLCHKTLPLGTCTVTVVSVGGSGDGTDSPAGLEKSIASGEVYVRDGVWYTVQESDINTALA